MRFPRLLVPLALAVGSALLYGAFYWLHPDRTVVGDWFLGSLAFVPLQVLLVTVIVEGMLGRRERQAHLKKLHMVIGVFMAEVGHALLARCAALEADPGPRRARLSLLGEAPPRVLGELAERMRTGGARVRATAEGLEGLRALLRERRKVLAAIMANPSVLEHESFADCLLAVFHLAEELQARGDLARASAADLEHLGGDVARVYPMVLAEWLAWLKHLLEEYPFLHSLAVRTNPFDETARVEVGGDPASASPTTAPA